MTLRVISLGAGVQSTTVLLMADAGQLGRVDAAIFADTGWEPRAVYEHLERLERLVSIPIHRVSGGNIRRVAAMGTGSALDAPFYLTNQRGERGMARRQCTSRLKVEPIRRCLRELMRAAGEKRAEQLMGISLDEAQRMRTSDVRYAKLVYPLVDLRMTRHACKRWLEAHGWQDVPRSACIGCPFHTSAKWRQIRDETPDEFADAVAWEREVQEHGLGLDATPYVHVQRVPLAEVDLSTPRDHGQLDLNDECAGVCGV